jgi:hypothetical protein
MSPGERPVSQGMSMPTALTPVFAALALIGAGSFISGALGSNPLRAWQAYLVNFLFWTGLSFGAVTFVAVLNVTDSAWGRPLKRLAEAFGAFLPVAYLLFWVLFFGRTYLFPWIEGPQPLRQAWLNVPFFFARNGAGLLLLTAAALLMIRFSLRADHAWSEGAAARTGEVFAIPPGTDWKRQRILSPILLIAYSFVLTLVGFDLVMSLDPHWYSSLFGAYFFVGCFYTGIVALCLLSLITSGKEGLKDHVRPRNFHDLGKLVLAFCLFTGYLFYAQFLTIWYGNVPEETRYVILRVKLTPWEPLAWVTLFMIFLVPFFVLLSRKIKVQRIPMIVLSLVIMGGMWLEKLILVAPSLSKGGEIPLGATEVFVTAGFLGVHGLCLSGFLKRVPSIPLSDPLLRQWTERRDERLEP